MKFKQLARARAGSAVRVVTLVAIALVAVACREGKDPRLAVASGESLTRAEQQKKDSLQAAPFSELAFVPGDAEALLRMDLVALADGDPKARAAFDYLLRAQQPAAWDFLQRSGISVAKELRVIYLIVGAPDGGKPTFAIAGVGNIDAERVGGALRRARGEAEAMPDDGALYTWKKGDPNDKVGWSIPPEKEGVMDTDLGATAVGVAPGLMLVGHPALVRRALETRGLAGNDARHGLLADELAALSVDGNGKATTWGVAHAGAPGSYLATLLPGLARARFAAALEGIGKGKLDLRAEFGTPDAANAFRGELDAFLAETAQVAGDTPLGQMLARLRGGASIRVDGSVVVASVRLE